MSQRTPQRNRKPWHKLTTKQVDLGLAKETVENRVVSTSPRKKDFLMWESQKGPSRRKSIQILSAPNFAAHGMRLIYGRGDHCGKISSGLEVFLRKDGRIFFRFSSPDERVVRRTYELVGVKPPSLPEPGQGFDDDWIPEILRDHYDAWFNECIMYYDCFD